MTAASFFQFHGRLAAPVVFFSILAENGLFFNQSRTHKRIRAKKIRILLKNEPSPCSPLAKTPCIHSVRPPPFPGNAKCAQGKNPAHICRRERTDAKIPGPAGRPGLGRARAIYLKRWEIYLPRTLIVCAPAQNGLQFFEKRTPVLVQRPVSQPQRFLWHSCQPHCPPPFFRSR